MGVSRSPSKIFCLTVPKYSVGKSFTVALISVTEKVWIRGKGEVEIFRPKKLCLTVPENSRRGIVFCCINFGYRKSLDRRGEEYPDFLPTLFCHTVPKIYVGESFSGALISGSVKVWIGGRGESKSFPCKFFCLTVPKESVRNILLLH